MGHWKLDDLPPRMRAQAESQLGLTKPLPNPVPSSASAPKVFAIPGSTLPEGSQNPRRRRGGLFKASSLGNCSDALQTPPAPSPAGFKSIVEMRAEKNASRKRKYLTPDMAETLVKSCKVSEDGTEVKFVLGCSPYMIPTAQLKKIAVIGGHPRIYKQPKVQKAEKTITLAMQPYAHLFKDWRGCPVAVYYDFLYEYPKGTPKKELIDYAYSIHKNDLDNSEKGCGDALTAAGFWEDDSRLAELHLRKFRTITKPRIILTIRKLPKVLKDRDMFEEYQGLTKGELEQSVSQS